MKFILTGFSRFSDVNDNPTQWIAEHIESLLKERNSPVQVESCNVLHVSGSATRKWVQQTSELCRDRQDGEPRIVVNMGLNTSSTHFDLESRAYNCADFRVPDEDGWQPQQELIEEGEDQSTDSYKSCILPLTDIADTLSNGKGHPVRISVDAGRFVCNWIYYNALTCQDSVSDGKWQWKALFVHFPAFQHISAEKQLDFLADLLETLHMVMSPTS